VVTSDLPTLRVFRDCPAVFLCSPGDEGDLARRIIDVLSLPDETRRELGEKGRAFVAQGHTWSQIARRTSEIILGSLSGEHPEGGSSNDG
jgi:glycosyltransferase involved in cell wall biosynthesis